MIQMNLLSLHPLATGRLLRRNLFETVRVLVLMVLAWCLAACGGSDSESDATGIFEATEVLVSAEGDGRLLRFTVSEGDLLTAGQEVGCIDTVQLSLERGGLMESLRSAGWQQTDVATQVAALRRQVEQAERETDRLRALLADSAATQQQYDEAEAQAAILRRNYEAQRLTLENANRSVAHEQRALTYRVMQLDDRLRKCRVVTPISGTVLAKYAEAGELTAAGRPLFKVADTRRLFLRAYVDAPLLTHIRLGDDVQVYADRGKDSRKAYPGKVVWISDQAEFTPKTIQTRDERANLVYAVKIAVENTDGAIKIGMYGEAEFADAEPMS